MEKYKGIERQRQTEKKNEDEEEEVQRIQYGIRESYLAPQTLEEYSAFELRSSSFVEGAADVCLTRHQWPGSCLSGPGGERHMETHCHTPPSRRYGEKPRAFSR